MINDLMSQTNQTPIEVMLAIDEDGRTSARKVYEFLQLNPAHYARWYKTNILENEFAEEGIDYTVFTIEGENPNGGRPTIDFKLTASFAKKLCMTQKNERGEQARNYFIKVEEKLKDVVLEKQPKSYTEMFALASQAMLEQERRLSVVETRLIETEKKQDNISEIISLNNIEWRKKVNGILQRIAKSMGGYDAYRDIRNESYKVLEQRAACKLSVRLTNKKQKMALEGVAKSKIDKATKMDVIADDARLTEIYLAIVKEMAIKYKVDLQEIN